MNTGFIASSAALPAREYVELHSQVQTSLSLLDSLESFLSTFQKDLSAVSGQISDLQERSKDIENRLKSRRKIEKPLSSLISDITIPPPLATQILDGKVDESWIPLMEDFEMRIQTCKGRSRVKAARDLGDVIEGLRIVTATKLRAFFIALFAPIRASVTTNMQVLQASVIMKYKPLFSFLQRQAPNVAQELQRSYIVAARTYYETGFRRYIRSLGWIKARSIEKPVNFVVDVKDVSYDLERLEYAKLGGKGSTLAFLGDSKSYQEPPEALFRSVMLVLMDNASAEYSFIVQFFIAVSPHPPAFEMSPMSPGPFTSRKSSFAQSDDGSTLFSPQQATSPSMVAALSNSKEDQAASDAIWKQIMEPVLTYTQTFVKTFLDPTLHILPLLTMIRLTEAVVNEVQKRGTPPLENFFFSIRLQLWPVFQKLMTTGVDEIKQLGESSFGGYFTKSSAITESTVSQICKRYVLYFGGFVTLTDQAEETMIFSNLLKLRQEVINIINRYSSKASNPSTKVAAEASIYVSILQGLSSQTSHTAHPKFQHEIAFWSKLEEEARRKLSTRRNDGR